MLTAAAAGAVLTPEVVSSHFAVRDPLPQLGDRAFSLAVADHVRTRSLRSAGKLAESPDLAGNLLNLDRRLQRDLLGLHRRGSHFL
jgi:hypothetical protein